MPRVIVIGAGAAGTMAAIFAASAGAETLLVERTKDGGRKILISGGGRCNILPARVDESRWVTDSSPHTLRNIVRSWPLDEQIAFFEKELRLPLVEEVETSKLFPKSQSARDVRDKAARVCRVRRRDSCDGHVGHGICAFCERMARRATGRAATARRRDYCRDGWLFRSRGYKKAEVTGGGVSLSEVDPKTMESRRYRGLFLCGEVLDAFGPIGGYNFLWAWATGRAAGLGAARPASAKASVVCRSFGEGG